MRKSAVQLLKMLVQKNPYAPTLPLSFFKGKLDDAQKQVPPPLHYPIWGTAM